MVHSRWLVDFFISGQASCGLPAGQERRLSMRTKPDRKRTPRAQSSPRTLAKGAWHRAKTARANGAGLPKARKQGKLASDPECWF